MAATDWALATTVTSADWTFYDSDLVTDVQTQDVVAPTYSWSAPHDYVAASSYTGKVLILADFETPLGTPLDIPTGATVNGIECRMTCAAYGGLGYVYCDPVSDEGEPEVCYYPAIAAYASKDGGTTPVGDKRSRDLNFGGLDFSLGGSTDLWGTTWTEAEAEAIAFRVFPEGQDDPPSGRRLDYYWVRIWYTEGSPPPPSPGVFNDTVRYIPGYAPKPSQNIIRR